MIHRFDPKGAPRVFVLPAVAVIVVGGSIVLLALGQVLIGVIALAISAWISYHLVRFTVYQFKSQVQTSDDELLCITSMGVETGMPWSAVSHAGSYVTERSGVYLFVYNESDDELLSIPPYYTDQEQLDSRIRDNVHQFLELSGASPDDLGEALKPHLDR
ncbi:MAG: hypothetical protein KAU31_06335 [Spirochaetaceae bacterium]|nr:hypothetical protein [Spirochaetaceae bacterium]